MVYNLPDYIALYLTGEYKMKIEFSQLKVGDKFYDYSSRKYFVKVCGNAANIYSDNDLFCGSLITFESFEIVYKC